MSRLPRVSGMALVAALERAGFVVVRVRGSHHFVRNESGRVTVVPVHRGEIIGPGLLTKILRDCGLTVDELLQLL